MHPYNAGCSEHLARSKCSQMDRSCSGTQQGLCTLHWNQACFCKECTRSRLHRCMCRSDRAHRTTHTTQEGRASVTVSAQATKQLMEVLAWLRDHLLTSLRK